jgi:nucleoside-diphosphate-sugar epimerase
LLENKPFQVWQGEQLRDFTYVDDAVNALLLAAVSDSANGKVFNLGGETAISLVKLAQLLVDVNGGGDFEIREFPSDRKKIDVGDYYADFTMIRDALGWQPVVPLRDGLGRTLAFYRQNLPSYL